MAKTTSQSSGDNQLTQAQMRKAAKLLKELVGKSKKQPPPEALQTLGKGLSGLGSKVASSNQALNTASTDELGALLFELGQGLAPPAAYDPCDPPQEQSNLADTLASTAMAVLSLGSQFKPPKDLKQQGVDEAKIRGTIDEVRCSAEDLAEAMLLAAATEYAAQGNQVGELGIPALGPADLCGCSASPIKNLPAPIEIIGNLEGEFPLPIGASSEEMLEILRQLFEWLVLIAILLSVMPAVGCTNNCTEGALRASLAWHGSDAQGNSLIDIKWEYCCLEACFLWVTGTYWDDHGTTRHTAGGALGRNRRTAATRRAKRVGTAAANWLSNGGAIPAAMRRHRIRPNLIAPASTC